MPCTNRGAKLKETVMNYASAVRGDAEPYEASVSSGYVKRGGNRKMMFHQQTPLGSAKEKS
jgi:hypothetical protein